jgi:hypothetical protein
MMIYVYGSLNIKPICYDGVMLKVNQIVNANIILIRALADSPNLSVKFRESLRRLASLGNNPVKVVKIDNTDGVTLTLRVQDSYNSLPAVMCEGYNGGQGVVCYFETIAQAKMLLNNEKTIELANLSAGVIESQQLVKLIYNNKNLVVMPVTDVRRVGDYRGVIGRAVSNILPYQTGVVKLLNISQAMDLTSFHKLTIKSFGG